MPIRDTLHTARTANRLHVETDLPHADCSLLLETLSYISIIPIIVSGDLPPKAEEALKSLSATIAESVCNYLSKTHGEARTHTALNLALTYVQAEMDTVKAAASAAKPLPPTLLETLEELVRLINSGQRDATVAEAERTLAQLQAANDEVRRMTNLPPTSVKESIKTRHGDYAKLTDHYLSLGVQL